MNFQEYLAATRETAHYAGVGTSVGALYCLAGLLEERAELASAANNYYQGWPNAHLDVLKEAGDILWYACRLAEDAGVAGAVLGGYQWDPQQVQGLEVYGPDPFRLTALARSVKRHHRDGTPLDCDAVRAVLEELSSAVRCTGLSLHEVAEANIKKLRDRKARGVIGGSGDNR